VEALRDVGGIPQLKITGEDVDIPEQTGNQMWLLRLHNYPDSGAETEVSQEIEAEREMRKKVPRRSLFAVMILDINDIHPRPF